MEKANLGAASVQTYGKFSRQAVSVNGMEFGRIIVQPGGGWSIDVKQHVGTDSCMSMHKGIMLSGTLGVKMNDGTEEHFTKDDIAYVPPGHDSWCVGDEPAVFLEFKSG